MKFKLIETTDFNMQSYKERAGAAFLNHLNIIFQVGGNNLWKPKNGIFFQIDLKTQICHNC
jgi:hypothetical protein